MRPDHPGRTLRSPQDETVEDTRWTEDSAELGWAVLMKDGASAYRQAEVDAVIEHQARCFVITRGDLTSAVYAERFVINQRAIFAALDTPCPLYTLSAPTDWSAYTPTSLTPALMNTIGHLLDRWQAARDQGSVALFHPGGDHFTALFHVASAGCALDLADVSKCVGVRPDQGGHTA
ncbi:hypothetical protein GCM10022419_128690 [Nonomuraea rosea]|uniref:VapC45 PIN like domain-containing protein n=1 Tax=Nonomuraea rosea TaxID=638574 RepID=A0ABP6ZXG3_9ACTN